MAKIKLLIDTDIIIDYLKGVKPAKALFRSEDINIYCSILSKAGLHNSERKRIVNLMADINVFRIDDDIMKKYSMLVSKYGEQRNMVADYLIAATAWAKNLPLLTRNIKHFKRIKEIKLSPGYEL